MHALSMASFARQSRSVFEHSLSEHSIGQDPLLKDSLSSLGAEVGTLLMRSGSNQTDWRNTHSDSDAREALTSADFDKLDQESGCSHCVGMKMQVRALAQSMAGLAAKVFNWSSSLGKLQRRDLAEMILEYCKPCAFLDTHLQDLYFGLKHIEWADVTSKPAFLVVVPPTEWLTPELADHGLEITEVQYVDEVPKKTAAHLDMDSPHLVHVKFGDDTEISGPRAAGLDPAPDVPQLHGTENRSEAVARYHGTAAEQRMASRRFATSRTEAAFLCSSQLDSPRSQSIANQDTRIEADQYLSSLGRLPSHELGHPSSPSDAGHRTHHSITSEPLHMQSFVAGSSATRHLGPCNERAQTSAPLFNSHPAQSLSAVEPSAWRARDRPQLGRGASDALPAHRERIHME